MGFVTEYPVPVPWNLSRENAKELLSLVRHPYKTCLVTGGSPDKVIELAEILRPSAIQLHYKETLDDTAAIARVLKELGIETVKTMPVTEEEQNHQFGTTDIGDIVSLLCQTEISGILADTRTPSNAAEKGGKADTALFVRIKELSSKPVILAGGITPGNVREMIEQTKAEHIDIMTGAESSPGVKDEKKLTDLLSAIKEIIKA